MADKWSAPIIINTIKICQIKMEKALAKGLLARVEKREEEKGEIVNKNYGNDKRRKT